MMSTPIDRFLDAHPDAAGAAYPALVRAAGWALDLPVIGTRLALTRRFHAVAQHAGRITLRDGPARASTAATAPLTVLSANLWHDWPRQHRWLERLEAVARLLEHEHADIVLLQEVARTRRLQADAWLADRLGLAAAYARANGDLEAIGFEEGLVVLTRSPIEAVHMRQFGQGRNPLARRIALAVAGTWGSSRIWAVSVHLALHRDHNARQLRHLRSWVSHIAGGDLAIVGGDFNAPEDRAEIEATQSEWTDAVRARHPEGPLPTHLGRRWSPRPRRLDYVFIQQPPVRPWLIDQAGHRDGPVGGHSDHRAVVARIVQAAVNGTEATDHEITASSPAPRARSAG